MYNLQYNRERLNVYSGRGIYNIIDHLCDTLQLSYTVLSRCHGLDSSTNSYHEVVHLALSTSITTCSTLDILLPCQ